MIITIMMIVKIIIYLKRKKYNYRRTISKMMIILIIFWFRILKILMRKILKQAKIKGKKQTSKFSKILMIYKRPH